MKTKALVIAMALAAGMAFGDDQGTAIQPASGAKGGNNSLADSSSDRRTSAIEQGEAAENPGPKETYIPALTVTTEGTARQLDVEGIKWDQISAIYLNERDITDTLRQLIKSGKASRKYVPWGFSLKVDDPSLLKADDGLISLVLTTGLTLASPIAIDAPKDAVSARAASGCSWLTFSAPTRTSTNGNCLYGSTNCAKPGYYHTGIDYSYSSSSPNAYASADGKVVRVEWMSSGDHGMGNNVIVEHTLSNCSKVYSTYSHLSSIDGAIRVNNTVSRGQKVGAMGGSGYGRSSYWGKHLHFEIKKKPVTSTPWSYNGTCSWGCWGYVPYWPDGYGYSNPRSLY